MCVWYVYIYIHVCGGLNARCLRCLLQTVCHGKRPTFCSCSGTVVVEAYWFGGKGLVCNERCSRYQSKPGPPLAPFRSFQSIRCWFWNENPRLRPVRTWLPGAERDKTSENWLAFFRGEVCRGRIPSLHTSIIYTIIYMRESVYFIHLSREWLVKRWLYRSQVSHRAWQLLWYPVAQRPFGPAV